jgi:hypothetical protein
VCQSTERTERKEEEEKQEIESKGADHGGVPILPVLWYFIAYPVPSQAREGVSSRALHYPWVGQADTSRELPLPRNR